MAVNEVPQVAQEKRYGVAVQTTWGTAIADDQAVIQLDCEPTEVKPDIKQLTIPQATGDRTPRESSLLVHTKGCHPTITIPNLIMKQDEIDHWLYSFYGQVTEGATTPYSKTFNFPATQASFATNAGHFFTLWERDPAASKSTKLTDCVVTSIVFKLEKGQPLKADVTFTARGAASFTANPSGTWTRSSLDIYHYEDLDRCTLNYGAGAKSFHLESATVSLSNTYVPLGQTGSGNSQYPALIDRKVEWTMKVVKESDFHTAYTNWPGNTVVDVNVGWGNATPGTVDADLDFGINGKITDVVKDHAGVLTGEIKGVGLETDDGSTDEACTVIMANAVDRTW